MGVVNVKRKKNKKKHFMIENVKSEVSYRVVCGDCIPVMSGMVERGEFVDLTVTSPPYDDLRGYEGTLSWDFGKFKQVADLLYRITRDGGVVVWVVSDQTVNGNKTLTSFRQALYFQEIGFKFHDNIIYEKNSSSFPQSRKSKRYSDVYEYCFVLVKGKKIRQDIELLCDKPNKWAGHTNWGKMTSYNKDGVVTGKKDFIDPVPEFSKRNNIWKYNTAVEVDKNRHPAKMPEKLAEDHVLSWSVPGDVVFDPFNGSGTTGKAALSNGRNYVGVELVPEYVEITRERFGRYGYSGEIA